MKFIFYYYNIRFGKVFINHFSLVQKNLQVAENWSITGNIFELKSWIMREMLGRSFGLRQSMSGQTSYVTKEKMFQRLRETFVIRSSSRVEPCIKFWNILDIVKESVYVCVRYWVTCVCVCVRERLYFSQIGCEQDTTWARGSQIVFPLNFGPPSTISIVSNRKQFTDFFYRAFLIFTLKVVLF